jgi:AraC-like DNA-binding protein
MVPCNNVWGNRLHVFESRLFAAKSTVERIDLAETFLMQQLASCSSPPDYRFWEMMNQIYIRKGHFVVERDMSADLSLRQVRRLFNRYIGISPKGFARIVRFQSVLHEMLCEPKEKWKYIYLDSGYYDQAHYINEFKKFFGRPPLSADFPKTSGNVYLKSRFQ